MTRLRLRPPAFCLSLLVFFSAAPPQAVVYAADVVRGPAEGGAIRLIAAPAANLPGTGALPSLSGGLEIKTLDAAPYGNGRGTAETSSEFRGGIAQLQGSAAGPQAARVATPVDSAPSLPALSPTAAPHALNATGPLPSGIVLAAGPASADRTSVSLSPSSGGEKSASSTPDPRREGLEEKTWTEAEKLGFERKVPAIEGTVSRATESSLVPADPSSASTTGAGSKPGVPAPKKALSMLSSTVLGFFSSFLLLQVIVEATALAGPQMADPYTQGFLRLAGVTSGIYLAYALGSYVGGGIVERFGLKKVYRTVMASRALIWAAMAFFYDPHKQIVPFVPLLSLFCLDYFVHSIGRVTEHTLHAVWSEDSPIVSNRFASFRDSVEYGTVLTTLLIGGAIGAYGFNFVMYGAPFVFAAAALVTMFLKGLPDKIEKAKTSMTAGFKAMFSSPKLRKLFLGQLLINNFFYLLCYVAATAFSVFVVNGDRDLGAAVSSGLTSFYGLGAFLGAAILGNAITNRIEKKTEGIKDDAERKEAQQKLFSKRAATALKWAAIALASTVWLLLNHSQLALVKLVIPGLGWNLGLFPIYPITLALVATGVAAQIALTLLDPIFKQSIPTGMRAPVVAANRTLTNLSYAANFLIWCLAFQFLGSAAFVLLCVACLASAGVYWWLARDMQRGQK